MDFEDAESIKSSFADNYRDFTQDPVEKCARASETPCRRIQGFMQKCQPNWCNSYSIINQYQRM